MDQPLAPELVRHRQPRESMSEASFHEIQDLALLIFHFKAKQGLPKTRIGDFMARYEILDITRFFAEKAVEGLQDRGFVEKFRPLMEPRITAKGITYVERKLREKSSFLQRAYIRYEFYQFVTDADEEDNLGLLDHRDRKIQVYGLKLCAKNPVDKEESHEWNIADEFGDLSSTDIKAVQSLLNEILERLKSLELSQQELAQALGQIEACQEIAEIPNPPWGVVKNILERFANSAVAELAKKVISIIVSGGS